MNIIYVARIDEDYSLDLGVAKKINGQISALEALYCNVDYLRIKNKKIMLNDIELKEIKYRRLAYRHLYNSIKRINNQFDAAYLRYVRADYFFLKTIKLLYKRGVKVIVEIPTYPYITEINKKTVRGILEIFIDNIITRLLKKYVFKISTTSKYEEIFGIETIKINNGIDMNSFPLKNKSNHDTTKVIKLIGIGNLARWHGYDRIIKGMFEYYKENVDINIEFYIVGEGNEKVNLEKLTHDLNMQKYVHFLGVKTGTELDNIFDEMDIGVSSLALFRAGGGHDPIKSKEFLARGIPIILAYQDLLIDMSLPYVFFEEESNSPIDMKKIIEKYKKVRTIDSEEIRNYSIKNLSWENQMKKVIKVLER
ncbi:glycosyltransferase [Clostridium isatidis]|uniref:Glycosyl transferase family 1 domain-containing protein n=1 Tax=Clostridium isatidis TaxID=182773 RepID=A0A343JA69_9CLOT|nr:glycosyltransferase [Clostridium isatidis]ASW42427.1 hypothetical protein BEN51_02695 [Clostridium isatidis]